MVCQQQWVALEVQSAQKPWQMMVWPQPVWQTPGPVQAGCPDLQQWTVTSLMGAKVSFHAD